MSFKDIFKQSFLSGFTSGIDTKSIVISLLIALCLGIYIFLIYRVMTRRTFYSLSFNISLVGMTLITAAIILTIQSNLVLSLGMVGALSIVRFRTAVKDPMDLVFLYWAISAGIICGAGLTMICVFLCLTMTAAVFALQKFPLKKQSMLLVVNSTDPESDAEILETAKRFSKVCSVKSKNLTASTLDMIIEIRVTPESELVHEVMKINGVVSASVLSHDGEITA